MTALLGSALGYRFTLPLVQLDRGIAYRGASTRLRHVVSRLLAGREVKVGVVGGSISWGHGSEKRGVDDWFSVLSNWLFEAFPRSNVTARNGCVPGVTSAYMILCMERSVDPESELVFVEFTLNDGPREQLMNNDVVQDMERLVRRLLALPRRPAVVIFHTPTHGLANYPRGHPKNPGGDEYVPFYQTTEDAQGAVAHYYDVQALSLRTALYRLAQHQPKAGFRWEDTMYDIHPGQQGHRIMADLAVHLLQQTALGLVLRPWSTQEEEAFEEPLPPPMYEGNAAPDAPMCLMQGAFIALVPPESLSGFNYTVEGTPEKPKPGYIATVAGAFMRVRLDTHRDGSDALVRLYWQHLKSYEKMGTAEFSCVSGCKCVALRVDGTHARKASQIYLGVHDVSQAKECVIEVKVLSETTAPEGPLRHKFKLTGVVASERPGGSIFDNIVAGGGPFAVREHNGERSQTTLSREGLQGGWKEDEAELQEHFRQEEERLKAAAAAAGR